MFRFNGEIDFSKLAPALSAPMPMHSGDGTWSVQLPGLVWSWKAGAADFAFHEGVAVLAAGRARDSTSSGGEAARWIERYRARGISAADDVGGGFAAVIADTATRSVVIWVDRFSIETICYRFAPGILAFSNSASHVPGSRRDLNLQALYEYFYFHAIPTPLTIYRDVLRVEPAHRVSVTSASAEATTYWQPRFAEGERNGIRPRMTDFVDLLRRSVEDEADERRTACFLSGGTDSSSVAGMLARLRGTPIDAYSIGFEADGYDEMSYARIAARHFNLRHHEYYITPRDLVRSIPQVAASFDQPFGNSSVLPAYYCALTARQDGFSRMLAGDGGDELFGGNSRYAMQKLFQIYEALPEAMRRRVFEPLANRSSIFRTIPGLRQAGGYVRHSQVPLPERFYSFSLLHTLGAEAVLDNALLAVVDPGLTLARQRKRWHAAQAQSLVNRMLAYDWKYTLADNDLPKVRMASQLADVSVGYPLLGRSLVDFSLALPANWKVRGPQLRWMFKKALRNFLPMEIVRKKKHGFGLPFGPWLMKDAALRELAEESLEGIARRGFVRPDFVASLIRDRVPTAPGYFGEMVWILMMLEQWLRAHPSSAAPSGTSAMSIA
jgi:asparagine synthase (glutamine-hydrolysing)